MSDKRYDYIDKEIIERIEYFRSRGHRVPKLSMIKTPEQIEGIRASGVINTGVLDLVASEIHAGMSTLEIDKLVHDYTLDHGAVPAPLNYEGFPKSVCTSINEVVCHGIPNEFDIVWEKMRRSPMLSSATSATPSMGWRGKTISLWSLTSVVMESASNFTRSRK